LDGDLDRLIEAYLLQIGSGGSADAVSDLD
jgi:hypothetical protein